jgi:hypothetical protein
MAGARRRGRRLLWVVAIGLAGLAIASAAAVMFRRELAEFALLEQLRGLGLEQAEVRIQQFDRDRVEIKDLRVGEDLVVPTLIADYSATGLFASRLDALRVSGLRLRGEIGDAGISFGQLDALLGDDSDGGGSAPAALPTRRVVIEDAQLEFSTPQGELLGTLRADARETRPGELNAIADVTLTHPLASLGVRFEGNGSPDALVGTVALNGFAQGEFGAGIHTDGISVAANTQVEFDRGEVSMRIADCATLRIDQLGISQLLSLPRPLELCIRSGDADAFRMRRDGGLELHLESQPTPLAIDLAGVAVAGELPAWSASGSPPPGRLNLTAHGGELRFPDFEIAARGIDLQVALAESPLTSSGELRIEQLSDLAKNKRLGDLRLASHYAPADDDTQRLNFEADVSNPKHEFAVHLAGHHDLSEGRGRADVRLGPFRFCPDRPKLTDVVPALRGVLSDAQGTIESHGVAHWGESGNRWNFSVGVFDLSAHTGGAKLEHLNAAFEIRDSGTPPSQLLSIGRINFGLELTNGEVLFQLRRDGQLAIESANFEFAGGSLTTSGTFDPSGDTQQVTFEVRNVDLGTLLEQVDLEGLSGTGTLEGELPIHRSGDEIQIRSAQLASTDAGGIIRYRAEGGAAGVGAVQSDFGQLLNVLEEFHYTNLALTIDGDAAGTVEVAIHLEGSNPAFRDGHPVNFNLSVESRLSDLLSTEGYVYQIPYTIEERLADFAGGPVNTPPKPCVHDP